MFKAFGGVIAAVVAMGFACPAQAAPTYFNYDSSGTALYRGVGEGFFRFSATVLYDPLIFPARQQEVAPVTSGIVSFNAFPGSAHTGPIATEAGSYSLTSMFAYQFISSIDTIYSQAGDRILTIGGRFSGGSARINLAINDAGLPASSPFRTGEATLEFDNQGGGYLVEQLYANASPVPEPATWAMMFAGVGSIGAALRRRRNRVPRDIAIV